MLTEMHGTIIGDAFLEGNRPGKAAEDPFELNHFPLAVVFSPLTKVQMLSDNNIAYLFIMPRIHCLSSELKQNQLWKRMFFKAYF